MEGNSRALALWLLLFLLAIALVVAGFQGTFGRALAALFAPSLLVQTGKGTLSLMVTPPVITNE